MSDNDNLTINDHKKCSELHVYSIPSFIKKIGSEGDLLLTGWHFRVICPNFTKTVIDYNDSQDLFRFSNNDPHKRL